MGQEPALITVLLLSGAIYMVIFFGASQLVSVFNSEGMDGLAFYIPIKRRERLK